MGWMKKTEKGKISIENKQCRMEATDARQQTSRQTNTRRKQGTYNNSEFAV